MARVLLSCLGTTEYYECVYTLEGHQSVQTRYTQVALAQTKCADWEEVDRIVVLTTTDSQKVNWEDSAQNSGKGLKSELLSLGLKVQISNREIPIGGTADEQMHIFKCLVNAINPKDQVILDITHGFRSLPLLASVVLDYAKAIKEISVAGVFYGCLEALFDKGNPKELPINQRVVPIFDLSVFMAIKDWTTATQRFISTGDPRGIAEVARLRHFAPMFSEGGNTEATMKSRKLVESFEKFADTMFTCRSPDITLHAGKLAKGLSAIIREPALEPLYPLFESISETIERFGNDSVGDTYEAARWCMNRNLVYQSYVFLLEAAISELVCAAGGEIRDLDHRDAAASALKFASNPIAQDTWRGAAAKDPAFTKKCIQLVQEGRLRVPLDRLDALRDKRNDLAHSGWRKDPAEPRRILGLLKQAVENIPE